MLDEQLMVCVQRMEEQFDWVGDQVEQFGKQLKALFEQFASMAIVGDRCRPPTLRYAEEEDEYSYQIELVNPFVERRKRK